MAKPTLVDEFKTKAWTLLRRQPFTAFRIVMESGDVVHVDHPENFAMWPGDETNTFHVYTEGGRDFYGRFAKVTAIEYRNTEHE